MGAWERETEVRGSESVHKHVCLCDTCVCVHAGRSERQSELCNALSNWVVYCCTVSHIAL